MYSRTWQLETHYLTAVRVQPLCNKHGVEVGGGRRVVDSHGVSTPSASAGR